MGKSKYVILSIIFIFLLNFVLADKVPVEGEHGLLINSWDEHNTVTNRNYTILWDVSLNNGILLTKNDTNCTFFTYKSGTFGTFIAGVANKTTIGEAWYKTIPASFISTNGLYNYQIDCIYNPNNSISGSYLANFYASPSGNVLDNSEAIIMLGSIFLIILISLIFFYVASESESAVTRLVFYTISTIFMLMSILFIVVIGQQTLWGFVDVLSGIETFWFVAKMAMTLGMVIFFVIIFLMMLRYWKIKRGLID